MDTRRRIKEVPGINEEKIGPLQSYPFDESSTPGQTAQEEIFSAAGLEFPLDTGRKDQSDSLRRGEGRGLPPEQAGEKTEYQGSDQNFLHEKPQKRIARVSSTD